MYIALEDIKKHLNIDYDDDNQYLVELIAAAEDYVATYTQRPLTDLLDGADLRPAAKHAIRLLVGSWYNSREAVTFGTPSELPFGLAAILLPLKKF